MKTKYSKFRSDYPTTPLNIIAYGELLEKLPKRELVAWVTLRQGKSIEEIGSKVFPAYGLPPVKKTTIYTLLQNVHRKLEDVLE